MESNSVMYEKGKGKDKDMRKALQRGARSKGSALTSSCWVAVVDILLDGNGVAYLGACGRGVEGGGLGLLASLVTGAEAELVWSGLVVCAFVETAFVADLG